MGNRKTSGTKRQKIIYIAGPLTTGGKKDENHLLDNICRAEKYQIALANAGLGSFCPHVHTGLCREKGATAPEEYYYELDMEILKRAMDAVLAIPGWQESKGAKNEVEWAVKNNIPVFYPESPEDIKGIIKWAREKHTKTS